MAKEGPQCSRIKRARERCPQHRLRGSEGILSYAQQCSGHKPFLPARISVRRAMTKRSTRASRATLTSRVIRMMRSVRMPVIPAKLPGTAGEPKPLAQGSCNGVYIRQGGSGGAAQGHLSQTLQTLRDLYHTLGPRKDTAVTQGWQASEYVLMITGE